MLYSFVLAILIQMFVVRDRDKSAYLHDLDVLFLRWNFVALVRVLLENSASVTTRNKMQLTPMQYAKVCMSCMFNVPQ